MITKITINISWYAIGFSVQASCQVALWVWLARSPVLYRWKCAIIVFSSHLDIVDLYDSYRLIWLPQKSFVGEWYPHPSLHIFDRNFQASACVHNFREGCGYPRDIISIKMCIQSLPCSSTCFHHPTPSWNQSPTLGWSTELTICCWCLAMDVISKI